MKMKMHTEWICAVKETVIVGLLNFWQCVNKSLCLTTKPNKNLANNITNNIYTTAQVQTENIFIYCRAPELICKLYYVMRWRSAVDVDGSLEILFVLYTVLY